MSGTAAEEDRLDIVAVSGKIGRAQHTIRQWLKRSDFPSELQPSRVGGREQLMWDKDQIDGLKAYARDRLSMRGSFGRGN